MAVDSGFSGRQNNVITQSKITPIKLHIYIFFSVNKLFDLFYFRCKFSKMKEQYREADTAHKVCLNNLLNVKTCSSFFEISFLGHTFPACTVTSKSVC